MSVSLLHKPPQINISRAFWRALFPHQREALQMIAGYIDYVRSATERGMRVAQAALVRMPTGSGKSGIIATAAQCFGAAASCLIVSPSDAICDQLIEDVRSGFWQTLLSHVQKKEPAKAIRLANAEKERIAGNKVVQRLLRSDRDQCLATIANGKAVVFVCTMHALLDISEQAPDLYDTLREHIDLVLVDEGHREPADQWSEAVRGLQQQTVLFTATPYRNDHKVFNIAKDWISVLTFSEALRSRFIRDVHFTEFEGSDDAQAFAKAFVDFVRGLRRGKRLPHQNPKFLIHCADHTEIQKVVEALGTLDCNAIGFHERFASANDPRLFTHVPSRQQREDPSRFPEYAADYWVHQWKLLEGVDIPELCVLGIYDRIGNGRSLVQQIGRILRNPGLEAGKTAFVFARIKHRQHETWKLFLSYEENFEQNPELYERRLLYDTMVAAMPEHYAYEHGQFRKRFDVNKPSVWERFRFALSCNIFERQGKKDDLETITQHVVEELKKEDADVRVEGGEEVDENTRIITYIQFRHPEILEREFLFQFDVAYVLLRLKGRYLYVVDSSGSVPAVIRMNYNPIYGEELQKMFDGALRVSQMVLRNTDLGDFSIRRRSMAARSIEATAPELNDFLHSFSSAKGAFQEGDLPVLRYIGLRNGRFSVSGREPVDLKGLVRWLDELHQSLSRKDVAIPKVFGRYAPIIRTPKDSTPVNILIDLPNSEERFVTTAEAACGENTRLVWDDKCANVIDGNFSVYANGTKFDGLITYDFSRRRYTIEAKKLALHYRETMRAARQEPVDLVQYLNREQAFRLILAGRDEVFGRGQFFRPRLNLAGRAESGRFDLLKILHAEHRLANMTEEKGSAKADGSGWEPGSVFDLIDSSAFRTEMHKDLAASDLLICDDMGCELADFIAVQSSKKIILIHAKAFTKQKPMSASAFQDVCGQALKNTDVLVPHNTEFRPPIRKWNQPWRRKGQEVNQRIRRPSGHSGGTAWSDVRRNVENPSVFKEVWLVVGNGLSVRCLEQELMRASLDPNILQLIYLLQSTWASVSRIANGFRVFCPP